ncbi:struthiocalcin-2-like [Pogoniulus pusillus]|uniref:struthiocalcin-2-like n=1 Tax=Pogoniulus pusillus TaxID=488313 RepID=UPI0030B94B01
MGGTLGGTATSPPLPGDKIPWGLWPGTLRVQPAPTPCPRRAQHAGEVTMTACMPLLLVPLGCLLLASSLRGQEVPTCARGWVPFGDGCYRFFSQELSWRRAEAFCQRLGGHLASVHSEQEQEVVAALRPARPALDTEEEEEEELDEGVWIGLHHPLGSQHWQWSDGSQLDFGPWQLGHGGRGCAALQGTTEPSRWHSDSCGDRKPFVCRATA